MDGDTLKINADFSEVDKAVEGASKSFAAMSSSATASLGKINNFFSNTFVPGIKTSSSVLQADVGGVFQSISRGITGAFGLIVSPIKGVFSTVKSVVTGVLSTIFNTVKSVFTSITGFITGTVSKAVGVIQDLLPLVGIGAFAGLIVGFREFIKTENAFTRVASAIKATGGAAGFTADQLKDLADEMEDTTRFGDDVAMSAQAIALQFTRVRGDILAKALKLSADAAVAWQVDLSSATDKVVRALNDPGMATRGLEAEFGKFTAQEKETIEQMVSFGQIAQAQVVILNKLAGTVGGAAAADLTTFSGLIEQTNNAMGDMWKTISGALVPVVKDVAEWFKKGAKQIEEWGPALESAVQHFRGWASKTLTELRSWYDSVLAVFKRLAGKIIDAGVVAAAFIKTAFSDFGTTFEFIKAEALLAFDKIKNGLTDRFNEAWDAVMGRFDDRFGESMDRAVESAKQAAANLRQNVPFANMFGGILGAGPFDRDKPISNVEVERAVAERGRARRLERERQANLNRFINEGKVAPEDVMNDAKKRKRRDEETKKLEEDARRARDAFLKAFAPNKDQAAEALKNLREALGGIFKDDKKRKFDRTGRPVGAPDDDLSKGGGGGGFEDLLALNKRIQGAATVAPEVQAVIQTSLTNKEILDQIKQEKELQKQALQEQKNLNKHLGQMKLGKDGPAKAGP